MTIIPFIALVVLLVALWRLELGVGAVILLWPAYLIRTTVVGIPITALELSLYALAAAFVIRSVARRRMTWPQLPRPLMFFIGLWIIAWILATIFSVDHRASLGAFKAWLVDPLLFGWLLLSCIRTERQRTTVISATMLSGAMVAMAGLVQLIWFRDTLEDARLSSFFAPVANYAAMFIGPLLVLNIGLLLWKQMSRWWWTAVAIMALALILTVSFGGYLAVGVGTLMLWWRWPGRRTRMVALLAGIVVAGIGLLALSRTPYLAEKFKTTDRSSSLVRTQIWRTSWEMIKERSWFGVGPNAYEPIYRQTIPRLYWSPLEWLVSQPHNLYLALWLETGLLGLISFFVLVMLWTRRLWRRVLARDAVAIACLSAMAAILAHGFVDTPLFKNDLALLLVFVLLLPLLEIEE